jgi:hypothetical protein
MMRGALLAASGGTIEHYLSGTEERIRCPSLLLFFLVLVLPQLKSVTRERVVGLRRERHGREARWRPSVVTGRGSVR